MGCNLNLNKDEINHFELESDPNEGGHVARRGPHSQLKLKLGQKVGLGKKGPISLVLIVRERRREKRRAKASSQDLQSSVGLFLSDQERKFIASTRGMRGYLEKGISSKNQEGRYREIEVVGFRRLPT